MTTQTDDRPSTEERVSRLEGAYDHLATKADVADVRTEIANVRIEAAEVRTEVAKGRADLSAMETRMRADLSAMETRMRADLSAMETRMVKWIVSVVGIGVAVTVALNRLLG